MSDTIPMPILTTKLKILLDDGWALHVVNSGPKAKVILSFNEGGNGPVRDRISVYLSHAQSHQLARALAGVTPQMGRVDIDDEDTAP